MQCSSSTLVLQYHGSIRIRVLKSVFLSVVSKIMGDVEDLNSHPTFFKHNDIHVLLDHTSLVYF